MLGVKTPVKVPRVPWGVFAGVRGCGSVIIGLLDRNTLGNGNMGANSAKIQAIVLRASPVERFATYGIPKGRAARFLGKPLTWNFITC